MKKTLTFLAGAVLASLWWLTFELPKDSNGAPSQVIIPAIFGTIISIVYAIYLALIEKD